jgi:sugar lactone lactonase YvrE
MNRIFFLFLLLFPVHTNAQIITTFAGLAGFHGYGSDEVPATETPLNFPDGVAVGDSGKVYIADFWNSRIRVVDPDGTIHTFAGNGSFWRTGDGGPATAAGINFPTCIALDGLGNLYFASDSITDPYTTHYVQRCSNIRKVDAAGIITTVCGIADTGFNGDGIPAIGAGFRSISGIAADSAGNIYINGREQRIRKINAAGIISTIAGNGIAGFSGDGGPATDAIINSHGGIAIDHAGNIYFSDAYNHRIRKINAVGTINTIAGDTTYGYTGDGGPATAARLGAAWGMACDKDNNLFFADLPNYVIREISSTGIITTVAGNGTQGYSGDGGPADSAQINYVIDVAVDKKGNLYLPDAANENVRLVSQPPALLIPIAGDIQNELDIYPNPSTSKLFVTCGCTVTSLSITNSFGQAVYSNSYNTRQVQVNIEHLPSGIYFARVNNYTMRMFVKQY